MEHELLNKMFDEYDCEGISKDFQKIFKVIDRSLKALDEIKEQFDDMHNQTSSELISNLYGIVSNLEG